MDYPKKLTDEEWNLLQKWSEYSKLDTWFELRSSDEGDIDYVYDMDNEVDMNLHDALNDLCEGIYIDKENWNVTQKEIDTWNELMDKFALQVYKI